jgi:hypothetical protein
VQIQLQLSGGVAFAVSNNVFCWVRHRSERTDVFDSDRLLGGLQLPSIYPRPWSSRRKMLIMLLSGCLGTMAPSGPADPAVKPEQPCAASIRHGTEARA